MPPEACAKAAEAAPKSVIVCATEDAWAETIVPKLVAAGPT
jgi:hypothetical protein